MDAALRLLLTNATAAGLLALVAWAASRLVKRPAVVHGLWLLALARLVTPPVVPLPVLPAWQSLLPGSEAPAIVRMAPRASVPSPLIDLASVRSAALPALAPQSGGRAAAAARPKAVDLRLASWLVLAVGVIATTWLTAWRFARFRRLLEHAVPAPAPVTARAREIANCLGLRRAPPVLLVPARIPPMLWPASGGPRLLIPEELLPQLTDEERDALLAHELAHLRRRDHWVRLLEIAATAVFWWYPVTWWARRALRRAEERCCDEWVLRVLPGSGGPYAEGLLKSLTFISREGVSLPLAASGAGPARDLEARLKEILMTPPLPRLNAWLRLALAAGAAVGLAVFPTHAQTPAAGTDTPETTLPLPAPAARAARPAVAAPPSLRAAPIAASAPAAARVPLAARVTAAVAPVTAAVAAVTAALQAPVPVPAGRGASNEIAERKLEAQRRALEKHRQELRAQQRALESQSFELDSRAEQEEMQAEAARHRAEGSTEQAALVERKIAAVKRRVDVQRRQLKLEAEQAALEARLQQAQQEREQESEGRIKALEEAGRETEADKLRQEMDSTQGEEEHFSQELRKQQEALEREMQQAEEQMQGLAAEEHVHELRAGTDELARSLAEQVAALKEALPQAAAQKADVEREIRRLAAALAALERTP
jgi:beta-lactamase regulating signal transducer with metallopeptidase domain